VFSAEVMPDLTRQAKQERGRSPFAVIAGQVIGDGLRSHSSPVVDIGAPQ